MAFNEVVADSSALELHDSGRCMHALFLGLLFYVHSDYLGGRGEFVPDWGMRQPQTLHCAGVMAFSEVMADLSALGRFSLELYDSGRCMRLDAAAQRALNVMRQRTDANDAFSLYGLMNRARTAMAKRLLKVAAAPDTCAVSGSVY